MSATLDIAVRGDSYTALEAKAQARAREFFGDRPFILDELRVDVSPYPGSRYTATTTAVEVLTE